MLKAEVESATLFTRDTLYSGPKRVDIEEFESCPSSTTSRSGSDTRTKFVSAHSWDSQPTRNTLLQWLCSAFFMLSFEIRRQFDILCESCVPGIK